MFLVFMKSFRKFDHYINTLQIDHKKSKVYSYSAKYCMSAHCKLLYLAWTVMCACKLHSEHIFTSQFKPFLDLHNSFSELGTTQSMQIHSAIYSFFVNTLKKRLTITQIVQISVFCFCSTTSSRNLCFCLFISL